MSSAISIPAELRAAIDAGRAALAGRCNIAAVASRNDDEERQARAAKTAAENDLSALDAEVEVAKATNEAGTALGADASRGVAHLKALEKNAAALRQRIAEEQMTLDRCDRLRRGLPVKAVEADEAIEAANRQFREALNPFIAETSSIAIEAFREELANSLLPALMRLAAIADVAGGPLNRLMREINIPALCRGEPAVVSDGMIALHGRRMSLAGAWREEAAAVETYEQLKPIRELLDAMAPQVARIAAVRQRSEIERNAAARVAGPRTSNSSYVSRQAAPPPAAEAPRFVPNSYTLGGRGR